MTAPEAQIIETWEIHQRLMLLLLEHLPEAGFSVTLSTRGGRDVARQLAHCHNVREKRLKTFAKKNSLPLSDFEKTLSPSRDVLIQAFTQSGNAFSAFARHSLEENDGKATGFKRGIVPMIGYYISHEAHHRGNILLTLKQSGMRISDTLKWNLWEWNKV